jgi:zinc D-Ala-D-Ala carboxypeptidase
MPNDYFPEGFSCKCGCGLDAFDPKMRTLLNTARYMFGRPIILNSACRCAAHNAAAGGARKSAHLLGPDGFCHAVDIRCYSDITRAELHEIFSHLGIRRFEVSDQHIHIDNAIWLPSPLLKAVTFAIVPEG